MAILATEGSDANAINAMKKALMAEGALPRIVGRHVGPFKPAGASMMEAEYSLLTASSVVFDAVYVPGGAAPIETLKLELEGWERDRDVPEPPEDGQVPPIG